MPSCWAQSGGPKYDVLDFSVKPERGPCCACARRWTSTPTCAPPSASTRWPISRRLKKDVVAGLRHHDHPRADERCLFRRADAASTRKATSAWDQHPATPNPRSPVSPRSVLRDGAQAEQQGLLDGEGQTLMESGHLVWREGVQEIHERGIPGCRAVAHVRRRGRDAGAGRAGPKQFDVIVTGQPVRRPAVGPCPRC